MRPNRPLSVTHHLASNDAQSCRISSAERIARTTKKANIHKQLNDFRDFPFVLNYEFHFFFNFFSQRIVFCSFNFCLVHIKQFKSSQNFVFKNNFQDLLPSVWFSVSFSWSKCYEISTLIDFKFELFLLWIVHVRLHKIRVNDAMIIKWRVSKWIRARVIKQKYYSSKTEPNS